MDETTIDEQNKEPESVIQYKCPDCGAPIKYSPTAKAIICEYCDGEFTLSQIKDQDTATGEKDQFDWDEYKDKLSNEKLDGMKTYACHSCGAVIETPKETMATKCPYCGNNIVLKNTATGSLKPNLIIPFSITMNDVKNILKKVTNEKKHLPFNYFKSCRVGDIQGIYIPYWLFSTKLQGTVSYSAQTIDNDQVSSYHDYTITTEDYALKRSGKLEISRLPVDASIKISNDMIDSIEPFDYSKLVPFDSKYLSGFFADRFDSSPDSELPRAKKFMMDVALDKFSKTIPWYSSINVSNNGLNLVDPKVEYAMMPVYLLNCKYQDQDFHYAINGQTGKFTGPFPNSKNKKSFLFALSFLIPAGLLYGLLLLIQIFF